MADMVLLKVDTVSLPNPSTYDIDFKDLDSENSYTSETGVLVREMIRANQHKISVAWDSLTQDECKAIMQAVSGKESFQLTYWDYYSMTFETGKFYANDRSVKGIRVKLIGGKYSLSFTITEF